VVPGKKSSKLGRRCEGGDGGETSALGGTVVNDQKAFPLMKAGSEKHEIQEGGGRRAWNKRQLLRQELRERTYLIQLSNPYERVKEKTVKRDKHKTKGEDWKGNGKKPARLY